MFKWIRKRMKGKWVLSVPNGASSSAKLTYDGREIVGIFGLSIDLSANDFARLTLHIAPGHLQATLGALNLIEIMEVESERRESS